MGPKNKLLMKFKNESIVKTTLRQLYGSKVDEIIVVLGHESTLVAKELKEFDLKMILNESYSDGMNGSIKTGISNASLDSNGYLICLGDQPLITSNVYDLIISNFELNYKKDQKIIQVPYCESQKGNPVCFSSYYKGDILKNIKKEGAKAVVSKNEAKVLKYNLGHTSILLDIDGPLDIDKIL